MAPYDCFSDLSSVKKFLETLQNLSTTNFYNKIFNQLNVHEIQSDSETGYSKNFWDAAFMAKFEINSEKYLERIYELEKRLKSKPLFKSFCNDFYNSLVKSEENKSINSKKDNDGRLIHRINLFSSHLPIFSYKQEGEEKWGMDWEWSLFIQPVFNREYSLIYEKGIYSLNESSKIKIISDKIIVEQEKRKRRVFFVIP